MNRPGKLHVRPDEEPDTTWISVSHAGKVCTECGHDDHTKSECPNILPFHQRTSRK